VEGRVAGFVAGTLHASDLLKLFLLAEPNGNILNIDTNLRLRSALAIRVVASGRNDMHKYFFNSRTAA
jgi:hypothetical protein